MLKSYSFDVDSNLLFTDNTIWIETLEHKQRIPKEISQEDYVKSLPEILIWEKIRHIHNNKEEAMINFSAPGMYEKSVFSAIQQKKFWPSWNKFLEANKYASPLAFITARGHPVADLKSTHKRIIHEMLTDSQREDLIYSMKERLWNYELSDNELIDRYLDGNFYAPCSNELFLEWIGKTILDSMSDRKNAAFEHFVLHVKNIFETYYGANFLSKRKIRVGFSDDTDENISWLHEHINQLTSGLILKYPEIKFVLYNTHIPDNTVKFSFESNG